MFRTLFVVVISALILPAQAQDQNLGDKVTKKINWAILKVQSHELISQIACAELFLEGRGNTILESVCIVPNGMDHHSPFFIKDLKQSLSDGIAAIEAAQALNASSDDNKPELSHNAKSLAELHSDANLVYIAGLIEKLEQLEKQQAAAAAAGH